MDTQQTHLCFMELWQFCCLRETLDAGYRDTVCQVSLQNHAETNVSDKKMAE